MLWLVRFLAAGVRPSTAHRLGFTVFVMILRVNTYRLAVFLERGSRQGTMPVPWSELSWRPSFHKLRIGLMLLLLDRWSTTLVQCRERS